MCIRRTASLVALALLTAGCSLVSDGAHVLEYRARRALEDARERHRDRQLAAAAWSEVAGREPGRSADYADGFRDGFVAHLFRGTLDPPPLPPARYRTTRSQTEVGYRAAEDWLNGFRAGAAEAQRRGLRDLVTGPSALRAAGGPAEEVAVPVLVPPSDGTPEPGVPLPPELVPVPPPMVAPVSPAAPAAALIPVAAVRSAPPGTDRPAPLGLPPAPEVVREPAKPSPPAIDPPLPRLTMRQFVKIRMAILLPDPAAPPARPSTAPAALPPRPKTVEGPRWESRAPDPSAPSTGQPPKEVSAVWMEPAKREPESAIWWADASDVRKPSETGQKPVAEWGRLVPGGN